MKKAIRGYMNEIVDNIEIMLASASLKDRQKAGAMICKFTALYAIEGKKEKDTMKSILLPALFLKDVYDEFLTEIDREYLDMLGEEVVKYAKENP